MKITNRRLCKIGTGRGFYIPDKHLSDNHIGGHFDLEITPVKQSVKESTPESIEEKVDVVLSEKDHTIKYQLLDLMKQHPQKVWLIQELVHKAMGMLEKNYEESKQHIELLLSKIPEIEKVEDVKFGDGLGYRLIE